MSLIILKDGNWCAVLNNVPGNLRSSQVLPLWLDYIGVGVEERSRYTAQWISPTDYKTMKRWHEMCAIRKVVPL